MDTCSVCGYMWIEGNRANAEDITDAEFQEEIQQALDDDNFMETEAEEELCLCPRDPDLTVDDPITLSWLLNIVERTAVEMNRPSPRRDP